MRTIFSVLLWGAWATEDASTQTNACADRTTSYIQTCYLVDAKQLAELGASDFRRFYKKNASMVTAADTDCATGSSTNKTSKTRRTGPDNPKKTARTRLHELDDTNKTTRAMCDEEDCTSKAPRAKITLTLSSTTKTTRTTDKTIPSQDEQSYTRRTTSTKLSRTKNAPSR